MKSTAILHFAPLELYPPVQNLLRELEKVRPAHCFVLTTKPKTQPYKFNLFSAGEIGIFRLGWSGQALASYARYLNYAYYNIAGILFLAIKRPTQVLYFETISAFPAYVYKRYFNSRTRILIHYHEYMSNDEYSGGMQLTRYFRRLEGWLFPRSIWVSHTNSHRMELFAKDILPATIPNRFILPNYPPASWVTESSVGQSKPVKIIYAGALSLSTMYVKEFASWVIAQQGQVTWNVYATHCADECVQYFNGLRSEWIKLRSPVEYDALPSVLRNYDVGVVLYTGHIPNYVFNAPNKIFEYLACGLDVWFPDVMLGSLSLQTASTYPKVIAVDFAKLEAFDFATALDRTGYTRAQPAFFSEQALRTLIQTLKA